LPASSTASPHRSGGTNGCSSRTLLLEHLTDRRPGRPLSDDNPRRNVLAGAYTLQAHTRRPKRPGSCLCLLAGFKPPRSRYRHPDRRRSYSVRSCTRACRTGIFFILSASTAHCPDSSRTSPGDDPSTRAPAVAVGRWAAPDRPTDIVRPPISHSRRLPHPEPTWLLCLLQNSRPGRLLRQAPHRCVLQSPGD